jgi:hypothetical protein
MSKLVSTLSLAFVISLAGAAFADQPAFDELDQDNDGSLSKMEAAKAGIDFAEADVNRDGRLDRKEYEEAIS